MQSAGCRALLHDGLHTKIQITQPGASGGTRTPDSMEVRNSSPRTRVKHPSTQGIPVLSASTSILSRVEVQRPGVDTGCKHHPGTRADSVTLPLQHVPSVPLKIHQLPMYFHPNKTAPTLLCSRTACRLLGPTSPVPRKSRRWPGDLNPHPLESLN